MTQQPPARTVMQEISPKLAELSAEVLFGDVWERPELSKRDRSLITVATLTALYRTDQLPSASQTHGDGTFIVTVTTLSGRTFGHGTFKRTIDNTHVHSIESVIYPPR